MIFSCIRSQLLCFNVITCDTVSYKQVKNINKTVTACITTMQVKMFLDVANCRWLYKASGHHGTAVREYSEF